MTAKAQELTYYPATGKFWPVPVPMYSELPASAEPGRTTLAEAAVSLAAGQLRGRYGLDDGYSIVPAGRLEFYGDLEPGAVLVPMIAFHPDTGWAKVIETAGPAHWTTAQQATVNIKHGHFEIYARHHARPKGGNWDDLKGARLPEPLAGVLVGRAKWVNFGDDPRQPRPAGLQIKTDCYVPGFTSGLPRLNWSDDLAFCETQLRTLFERAGVPAPVLFMGDDRDLYGMDD